MCFHAYNVLLYRTDRLRALSLSLSSIHTHTTNSLFVWLSRFKRYPWARAGRFTCYIAHSLLLLSVCHSLTLSPICLKMKTIALKVTPSRITIQQYFNGDVSYKCLMCFSFIVVCFGWLAGSLILLEYVYYIHFTIHHICSMWNCSNSIVFFFFWMVFFLLFLFRFSLTITRKLCCFERSSHYPLKYHWISGSGFFFLLKLLVDGSKNVSIRFLFFFFLRFYFLPAIEKMGGSIELEISCFYQSTEDSMNVTMVHFAFEMPLVLVLCRTILFQMQKAFKGYYT